MSAKKSSKTLPSQKYLRECFAYDAATGFLLWKERPRKHFASNAASFHSRFALKTAGTEHNSRGVQRVVVGNKRYKTHRVIWKLVTGEEPTDTIDHVDGNPANNVWTNLRPAGRIEQTWNRKLSANNKSGYRGVHQASTYYAWEAQINIYGKKRQLGSFTSPEEASSAYEKAARELHGEFYVQNGERKQ